jgi:opacity protein-like surface antigen
MPFRRSVVLVILMVSVAATASADTVRVVVERALVWTQPAIVSIVMTQLLKGQRAEVVRRVGDWYEIVAPPGSGGGNRRTGFISASQVVFEPGGSLPTQRPGPARPAPAASARNRRQPYSRVLNIDAGYRVGVDLTRSFSAFDDFFAEAGSIATNYGNRSGAAVDVLYAQPVKRSFGVGVGGDYYFRAPPAAVTARVPHPFFFNRLRTSTFDAESLSTHEGAIHASAVWMPRAMGRLRILAFGGPSLFHVSQTVVTDVGLDEQYPYDTVTITGVRTAVRTSTRFGYHAGGDVSYLLRRSMGVGGGVRYSRAKLKFDNDDGVTTDGRAGGLSVVGGLRFRF